MKLKPLPNPGKSLEQNSFLELKQSLITPILWLISIIAVIAALATLPANLKSGSWYAVLILAAITFWLLTITLARAFSFRVKAVSSLAVLYFYGIYALISTNLILDGKIILGCFITAAFILFPSRQGIMAAVLSVATILIAGGISLAVQRDVSQAVLFAFVSSSLVFILAVFLLAFLLTLFNQRIESYIVNRDYALEELNGHINRITISNQQAVDGFKMSQRSLEITNQFSEQFSIDADPDTVLSRAVTYLRSEFDYYFVAVFVPDENNEFAILKAGTGPEGNSLLSIGYQVNLSDISLVSHAFNRSEIRLSPNVHTDIDYLENPLLLETKSELTIPLIVNQRVIAVLDVESARENDFSSEDIKILRTCADQLANAYEKATLKLQLSNIMQEFENAYKQFTQRTWKTHLRANKKKFSYHYKDNNFDKEALQPIEVLQAINQGEPIVMHSQPPFGTNEKTTSLAIPIKLRGQSIGAMDIKLNLSHIPGDLLPLIETISDRLAVALENARLLEEIQNKADREHQVGEISNKIRSSPNVEQILRTAVAEIGQSLGASEVSIQLRSDQ